MGTTAEEEGGREGGERDVRDVPHHHRVVPFTEHCAQPKQDQLLGCSDEDTVRFNPFIEPRNCFSQRRESLRLGVPKNSGREGKSVREEAHKGETQPRTAAA